MQLKAVFGWAGYLETRDDNIGEGSFHPAGIIFVTNSIPDAERGQTKGQLVWNQLHSSYLLLGRPCKSRTGQFSRRVQQEQACHNASTKSLFSRFTLLTQRLMIQWRGQSVHRQDTIVNRDPLIQTPHDRHIRITQSAPCSIVLNT